jgi:hypothetical protein
MVARRRMGPIGTRKGAKRANGAWQCRLAPRWTRMGRQMEGGGGGRFCRRNGFPMIERNFGAGSGTAGGGAAGDGGQEGMAPLWVGFGGMVGCRRAASRVGLHALIVARSFYGGKCGRGWGHPGSRVVCAWRRCRPRTSGYNQGRLAPHRIPQAVFGQGGTWAGEPPAARVRGRSTGGLKDCQGAQARAC